MKHIGFHCENMGRNADLSVPDTGLAEKVDKISTFTLWHVLARPLQIYRRTSEAPQWS